MTLPPEPPERSLDLLADRVARSALVGEIWMRFGSTLEWERLLPMVVERTVGTIGAEAGSLWLLSPDGTMLTCAVATGPTAAAIQGMSLPVPEGIIGSVAGSGEARFVPDVSAVPEFAARFDAESGFQTRCMIAAAIRGSGRILGAVEVINKNDGGLFTQDDLDLLLVVCGAAGQALENARLHRELEGAYARVAEANRRLVELDRSKSEFIAVASHELRTPLSALAGYLDLLRLETRDLPESLAHPLQAMHRSVERLSEIIVRITDALRVDHDAVDLAVRPVDPGLLAREVVDELSAAAQARRLVLDFAAEDGAPCALDPEKLKIALGNVVRNAIRFTPDHGRVDVRLTRPDRRLCFRVHDTGIGIQAGERERIFDRFATGADPMGHHSGTFEFGSRGLGLGLYLARAIVRAHGGDIHVESALGRGSTFELSLPAVPVVG